MTINSIFLAGFPVLEATQDQLANYLIQRIRAETKTVLFFANTNFIVQCMSLSKSMSNDDVLIVNDGVGMDIALMLLQHRKFKTNLNGTDFMPFLFTNSGQPLRIFLLGGKPDVLDKAANHLKHNLGQVVAGRCDGYDGIKKCGNLIKKINNSHADIVLVAMGNPKQEQWILDNYDQINAKLFSGVGALFDFWAGDKPRAPKIIQNIRMEWLYRLSHEPRRLLKRYTTDILKFLVISFKYRKYNH